MFTSSSHSDEDTLSDDVSRSSTLPSIQEEEAALLSHNGSVRSRRSIRSNDGSRRKDPVAQDQVIQDVA